MRRISISFLLLAALSITAMAETTTAADALELNLKDGHRVTFELGKSPEMTFGVNELTLTTSTESVVYDMANVSHIRFINLDGVESPTVPDVAFEITPSSVTVRHLDANADVRVYDMSGHCLAACGPDADGCVTVDISSYAPGVYIVTAEGTSYKLIKH
ncbi:MAG: T9SS type A sorting domain-containing protein [Muribaculaceae bacterium]|nr:T9SS type A sorting domain-containing protein [Muribaculaceae bacterium]